MTEIKSFRIKTPFDYAQGDGQAERSRSLVLLAKLHGMIIIFENKG